MIYGDGCTGMSAPTAAWKGLGWRAAFYSEIDPSPSAVLAYRYPTVKNHGDFTTIQKGDYEPIDVLVAGTPCQDFSIAGLRAGMGGERGNLTLEFLRLVDRLRPRWVVWENVPGVLSSTSHVAPDQHPPNLDLDGDDEPRDGEERVVIDEYESDEVHAFNSFLAGFSELGYGFAYRTFDAQYAGVPQRRRRIFVVGHIGRLVEPGDAGAVWDVRDASALSRAVLFERQSLSGDTPPRRESGQGFTHDVAPSLTGSGSGSGRGVERAGETRGQDPVVACQRLVCPECGRECEQYHNSFQCHACEKLWPKGHGWEKTVASQATQAFGGNNTSGPIDIATAVNASGSASGSASGRIDFESETFVCSTLDANYGRLQGCSGQDANHGHSHLVPISIQGGALRENPESGPDGIGVREDGIAYTLESRSEVQTVAFTQNTRDEVRLIGGDGQVVGALSAEPGMKQQSYVAFRTAGDGAIYESGDVTAPLTTATDPGANIVAFSCKDTGGDADEISPMLRSMGHDGSHANAGGQVAVAFQSSQSGTRLVDAHATLDSNNGSRRHNGIVQGMAVRRLTPRECERLQGFEDDFTLVPYRNGMMADGPRYKMLGNSMAVPVVRWIGERIQMVEDLA